jgi:hypothetical protein
MNMMLDLHVNGLSKFVQLKKDFSFKEERNYKATCLEMALSSQYTNVKAKTRSPKRRLNCSVRVQIVEEIIIGPVYGPTSSL